MSKIKPHRSTKDALLILSGFLALTILVLWIAVLMFPVACHKPSETDMERLSILKTTYGHKFHFKLEDEFYLKASLKHEAQVDEEELKTIYKTFFFDEAMEGRRDTSYIYLNLYNSKGKFQYQTYYSFRNKRFEKSDADHY